MTITAIIMGVVGILSSFVPQEPAKFLGWANTHTILLQILGAILFGCI
jgi:hypothetical protein